MMHHTPHNQRTSMAQADEAKSNFAHLVPLKLTFLRHQSHLLACVLCHSIDCALDYSPRQYRPLCRIRLYLLKLQ